MAGASKTGTTASYTYNPDGIRTSKTVNVVTTNYYLEGDKVIYETSGTNYIYYLYDESGNLVGFNRNGTQYYYYRNAQSDILGLLNANGTVAATYEYDTWGKLTAVKDGSGVDQLNNSSFIGNINPYRYRGYRYDVETGNYYLQSRYYSPEWGRMINADNFVKIDIDFSGHNLFSYCSNDPINREDPNGHWWLQSIFKNISMWLNSTPVNNITVPSSDQILSNTVSTVVGSTVSISNNILGRINQHVNGHIDANNYYRMIPGEGIEVPKYPKITSGINKSSTILAAVSGTLDIANTWTANNNNTNLKRVEKTAIQVGGIAASFGVGYMGGAMIIGAANAWNPMGWIILGSCVIVGGAIAINAAQSISYDVLKIE